VSKIICVCSALIVFFLAASPARAQSLAEVAKQEEARRKAIKTPSKVYTNDDLKKYGPATAPAATPEQKPAAPATGQDATAPKEAAPQPAAEEEPAKDEAWWRKRITDARATLDRSQVLADALQSRINGLWADFTARDDPAQRAVIQQDRLKALAELDRMKSEIDAQKQAIADIEEEARREGVPPGWLR
jgi:hypothetical protein